MAVGGGGEETKGDDESSLPLPINHGFHLPKITAFSSLFQNYNNQKHSALIAGHEHLP